MYLGTMIVEKNDAEFLNLERYVFSCPHHTSSLTHSIVDDRILYRYNSVYDSFTYKLSMKRCFWLLALRIGVVLAFSPSNTVSPPPISRATKLPNLLWIWRNHQIRYQVAYPTQSSKPSKGCAILVHGLFVNSVSSSLVIL